MQTVLTILHVFVCVFMILVILLQPGKEGGLGAATGGTSSSVFGGRGSATFLSKVTTVCAAIFMMTSLTLAYLSSKSESAILKEAAKTSSKPADAKPADTKAADAKAAEAKDSTATAAPAPAAGAPTAPTAPAIPAPAAPAPTPAAPAPAH
jgi:preprotein translocase subunit SecG